MQNRLILSCLCLAACGGSDAGPSVDYSKCRGATAIVVADGDINQPSGLAIPSGDAVDISLQVLDGDGNRCDPKGMQVVSSVNFDVVNAPEPTTVASPQDFMDVGSEPAGILHASLRDLSTSWGLIGVVDLSGEWTVVVTEERKFPAGFSFGKVKFEQHGRRLVWKDCTIAQACDHAGWVQDDLLIINVPSVALDIAVHISPDRQHMAGDWTASTGGSDYKGTFTADRADK